MTIKANSGRGSRWIRNQLFRYPITSYHHRRFSFQRRVVATPLPFAPKSSSSLLTPLQLKGTASILNPKWVHLTPCLGAALTTSPVIPNLLRIGQDSSYFDGNRTTHLNTCLEKSSVLANHVFFQMIRESSIHITKTKSMPAAYLSPKLIGTIIGQTIINNHKNNNNDDNNGYIDETMIKSYLHTEYGIRSNRIHNDQWTGISLTRWLDLFRLTTSSSSSGSGSSSHADDWISLVIWLTALWETSHSKLCLLDYLLECNRQVQIHYGQQETIFVNNNDKSMSSSYIKGLQERDPNAIEDWMEQIYSQSQDLSLANVEKCIDQIIFYNNRMKSNRGNLEWSNNNNNNNNWEEFTNALEVVCSSVALQQVPCLTGQNNNNKPTVPNGYFGYAGGDVKADCVEVTIREIIDLLLWDEESGSFDLSRLPSTASSELIDFYTHLPCMTDDDYEVGKRWFDLLSNLKDCDYLATSHIGEKGYELAPTMDNVAKVCSRLLVDKNTNNPPCWTKLPDLAKVGEKQPLGIQTDTLVHHSGDGGNSSSDLVVKHEIATIQLVDNPNCIEIRMRCDKGSGFSAVTHLRQSRKLFGLEQLQSFRDSLVGDTSTSVGAHNSPSMNILALCLISDIGLLNQEERKQDSTLLLLDLLSAPYGCDRRGVVNLGNNDLVEQSRLQKKFNHAELEKSQDLIRTALFRICYLHKEDPKLCLVLLTWILQESPTVVESSSSASFDFSNFVYDRASEEAILSLPVDILGNKRIQTLLWNNQWGLFRGRILTACAQLKSRQVSISDIILGDSLDFGEILSLASLLYSSSQQSKSK